MLTDSRTHRRKPWKQTFLILLGLVDEEQEKDGSKKMERRKKKEERDVNGDGAKLLSWGQASLPLTE